VQYILVDKSTQRAQTLPRPLQCRPLVSDSISYTMPYLSASLFVWLSPHAP